MTIRQSLLISFFVMILAACGGSSSGSRIVAPSVESRVLIGQFIDSPVQGLAYRAGGLIGITDQNGSFTYRTGDQITFTLAGVDLPAVAAAPIITPRDLFGVNGQRATLGSNAVVNLARLLQTLDEDQMPSNGIDISQQATLLANRITQSRAISFTVDPANFREANVNPALSAYLNNTGRNLREPEEAKEHLRCSEEDVAAGLKPDGICGESPRVSAANVSVLEGNTSNTITITFTLSSSSASTASFSYRTVSGTAIIGSDVVAAEGVITFPAGTTSRSLSLTVLGDVAPEADEVFTLALGNPVGLSLPASSVSITLLDDDTADAPARIRGESLTVGEGSGGGTTQALLRLTRQGDLSRAITVRVQSRDAGSALAGSDYQALSQMVTFPANATSQTVPVSIVADNLVETNEFFLVDITSSDSAVDITNSPIRVTITDDDPVVAQPGISIADASVQEPTTGSVPLTVTLTRRGNVQAASSVRVRSANGSATAGDDYVAVDQVVSFAAGATSQTLTVMVLADAIDETTETFALRLTEPDNGFISDGEAIISITDRPPLNAAPTVTLTDRSVAEGNAPRNETLTLQRSGNVSQASSVRIRVLSLASDTATADIDYEPLDQVVNFPASAMEASVIVRVLGDSISEANETFTVMLSEPNNASLARTAATITLIDDDNTALPSVSLRQLDPLNEGNAPQVINAVAVLSEASSQPIMLTYSTQDGSATSQGSRRDFMPVMSQSVMIPAGATEVSLPITVIGDSFEERDEQLSISITPISGARAGGALRQVVTLVNDEAAKLLRIGSAMRSVTPSQLHIDGVMESYQGGTRLQQFHLGGYGFGPFNLVPGVGPLPELKFGNDPLPISNAAAGATCFSRELSAEKRTELHCDDEIAVRVMVMLDPKTDERVAFVTLDAIGAGNLIQDAMRAAVNRASCDVDACITERNVLFGQTHTHAGADLQGLWGGVPRDWINNSLLAGAQAATQQAITQSRPAQLSMSRKTVQFNNYRRPQYRDAKFHQTDKIATLLMAKADDAEPTSRALVASLFQYSSHPTSIGANEYKIPGGNGEVLRLPHPDFPLGSTRELEQRFTGTALYFNGPIADASPSGSQAGANEETVYDRQRNRGKNLVDAALSELEGSAVAIDPVLEARSAEAILPVTNPLFLGVGLLGQFNGYYQFSQLPFSDIPGLDQIPTAVVEPIESIQNQLPQPAPLARTFVSRISLGTKGSSDADKNRLEIVTIPGEATGSFGRYIRGLAEETADGEALKTQTMLLGLTQNSFGYIIPEEEFSYIDPTGDVVGYEETVSLGPLTAPLLRLQAYNPLFDVPPTDPRNLPPALTDCAIGMDFNGCIFGVAWDRFTQFLGLPSSFGAVIADGAASVAAGCRDVAGPLAPGCALFDLIAQGAAGIPAGPTVPGAPGNGGDDPVPAATPEELALLPEIARAQLTGCDFIDPAACLLPFPNNHFTQVVVANDTGRQVNINPLAPPRNIAGRPIDVSDQNRADGFSPGQAILVRVPGLDLDQTAAIRPMPRLGKSGAGQAEGAQAPAMSNSLRANSAIIVWDVTAKKRHLVWAELDNNRTRYTPCDFPAPLQTLASLGGSAEFSDAIAALRDGCNGAAKPAVDGLDSVDPTSDPGPTLIIRPGINFEEGHRYIVALRDLRNANGEPIAATAGFALCRDNPDSPLRNIPVVGSRCAVLDEVFAELDIAGISKSELYSAWDFTVASERSLTGRLLSMRDKTMKDQLPTYAISSVVDNTFAESRSDCRVSTKAATNASSGDTDNCIARVIKGTITVPNFIDKAQLPAEQLSALPNIPGAPFSSSDLSAGTLDRQIGGRFYFGVENPAPGPYDVPKPFPLQPTVDVPFTCHIPRAAFSGASNTADSTSYNVRPSRVSLYGHGLFGGQSEIGQGQLRRFGGEHNYTFCALDWVGMAGIGDVANAVTILLDMSNFPTLSDRVQQGILQFVAMGRLLADDNGLVKDPAFQAPDGRQLIDNREIFYDGNSQGGIDGGVVVAVSPDIHRGALGVPGMNYSTLLQRSVDFDGYARVFYPAYPNTIDQQLTLGLVQMLWDRSENNGYAQHLGDGVSMAIVDGEPIAIGEPNHPLPGLDGQPLPRKDVLLHPAFGDHQVSMTTAEVMARTIGADTVDVYYLRPSFCSSGAVDFCAADRNAFLANRHPDTEPYFGLPLVMPNVAGYGAGAGSALIVYDGGRTPTPPADNTPPFAGADPHEYPRNTLEARCQKARFLRSDGAVVYTDQLASPAGCPLTRGDGTAFEGDAAEILPGDGGVEPPPMASASAEYGSGIIGAVARFMASLNEALMALLKGDPGAAGEQFIAAMTGLGERFTAVFVGDESVIAAGSDAASGGADPVAIFDRLLDGIGRFIGLQDDPLTALASMRPARESEAVVLSGAQLTGWATPPAVGQGFPYPSGANISGQSDQTSALAALNAIRDPLRLGEVRDAHNGQFIYPLVPEAQVPALVPIEEVAAYRWSGTRFEEIPVQVDEKFTFFLANAGSSFSVYSGTDPELTYAWDIERWNPVDDANEENSGKLNANPCLAVYEDAKKDPVPGLDLDDEIVFMASDAGAMAPPGMTPPGAKQSQIVRLIDVVDPASERVVYLVQKAGGSAFKGQHYVKYTRNADADQWIDRSFFLDNDPEKLGTSNTNYGQNLKGTVCPTGIQASAKQSLDRFARDGVVVTTDTYRWEASGRWMLRDIRIKPPGMNKPDWAVLKDSRPDLIDRWKGRAFQQSPDSTISLVGFEDEQVNWEANSVILGERCGPVRCMREVWGADSGTNVTKVETFYRDAISYRYRVRVHPIPPDGLYTSWDYNRGVMIPTAEERTAGVKGGRYFTALRPQGVPIDGINDDIGQVDAIPPIPLANQCITADGPRDPDPSGRCPLFLDFADPTFNLPLAFSNWEQVSGKGNSGSLVYTFQLTGATSLANPLVVPFYRDDACLDDGTGDDPVVRPYPGDTLSIAPQTLQNPRAYKDNNGDGVISCDERQGVYAANGIHYFVTHDSDNAFAPVTSTEVDGTQWQIMVPTEQPRNIGDAYANTIRIPLIPVIIPMPGVPNFPGFPGS